MHKQTRGSVRLRAWMVKTGTTQKQLGERIKTHQTNVSAWLQGRPISLPDAVALKRVTKIAVEDWTVPADESGTTLEPAKVAS